MFLFLSCLLITVVVHELAHMLVALANGIGVEAFAVGFGTPLLHKKIKGIDFRLCPIPLGGYCKLQGERKGDKEKDFCTQPYSKKFAVLIAGVAVNFLLACLCYLLNYGDILYGMKIDWLTFTFIFTKQQMPNIPIIFASVEPNIFLWQLSLMNLLCAIGNLVPILPLDGGMIWYYLIDNKISEKVKKILYATGLTIVVYGQILILWHIYS